MATKGFITEPTAYEKTAISDLQGSWVNLRDSVVENFGFPESDKLLFHIDEAMSWESVRNLKKMEATLLLIQNIATQTGGCPGFELLRLPQVPELVYIDASRQALSGLA